MKKILCYSGGKDSTALLLHIIKNNLQLDEILYVDMGEWIWNCSNKIIKQIENQYNIKITRINVTPEIKKGFERYGFPSFKNRWCTGIKRDAMKQYLKEKYNTDNITQYIGICADEKKRINKKLYHSYNVEYPLVNAGINTTETLKNMQR